MALAGALSERREDSEIESLQTWGHFCSSKSLCPPLHQPYLISHQYSIHLLNQRIDLLLSVPQITTLNKMLELPRPKPTSRIRQLERPQKVARLLEIIPHNHNLMDQILHADDPEFTQLLFDDLVVCEGDALLVDFAVSALVNQVADGLDAWVAVGDPGFDDFEHFGGGFCEFDEDAVVDLQETEELEDFAGLRGDLVDTV